MTIEQLARKIIREHHLVRIGFSISDSGVVAKAYPAGYHPKVEERRLREIEAAAVDGSISMNEASAITHNALRELATVRGDTVETALEALRAALKKLP